MKGQGSLEYLIIIAGVLSVAAIVTLFVTNAGSQSAEQQMVQQCFAAASECKLYRQGNDRIECPNTCARACSDPRTGKDLKTGQIIYDFGNSKTVACPKGSACGFCRVGQTIGIMKGEDIPLDQDIELVLGEQLELDNGFLLSYDMQNKGGEVDFVFTIVDLQGNPHTSVISVPGSYDLKALNDPDDISSLNGGLIRFTDLDPQLIISPKVPALWTQQGKFVFFGKISEKEPTPASRLPTANIIGLKPFVYDAVSLQTDFTNRYYKVDEQQNYVLISEVSAGGNKVSFTPAIIDNNLQNSEIKTIAGCGSVNPMSYGGLMEMLDKGLSSNNKASNCAYNLINGNLQTIISNKKLAYAIIGPEMLQADLFIGEKRTLSISDFEDSVQIVSVRNMGDTGPTDYELDLYNNYEVKLPAGSNIAVFDATDSWVDDQAGYFMDGSAAKWRIVNTGSEDATGVNLVVEGRVGLNAFDFIDKTISISSADYYDIAIGSELATYSKTTLTGLYNALRTSYVEVTVTVTSADDTVSEDNEASHTLVIYPSPKWQ